MSATTGAKVLVVEDEGTLALLMRMFLEDEGFDVRVASDGQHGLDLFYKERPDIVVTDYMMPRMDGSTMVARLRAAGERVPVIMASAVASRQIAEVANIDVDAFLSKPYRDSQLIALIRRQLAKARLSGSDDQAALRPTGD